MRYLLLLLLTGCAQVSQIVPSLQYCDEIDYKRRGSDVELRAKCVAPVGERLL